MSMYDWARQEVQLAGAINRLIDSKKVIHGNSLGQPFRSEKTFEEILSGAAKKFTENIKNSLQTP